MLERIIEGANYAASFFQPPEENQQPAVVVVQKPAKSFLTRYLELTREEPDEHGQVRLNKIPDLLIEHVNEMPREECLMTDRTFEHAIDQKTYDDLKAEAEKKHLEKMLNGAPVVEKEKALELKNPFNPNINIVLIPNDLDLNFSREELSLLNATLDARLSKKQDEALELLKAHIEFAGACHLDDFTREHLLALEATLKDTVVLRSFSDMAERPNLLTKLDFYIRRKMEIELCSWRDDFINSLEKIKTLKETIAEVTARHLHLDTPEILDDAEIDARMEALRQEKRGLLIELTLELIAELAKFLKETLRTINASTASDREKQADTTLMLADEKRLYDDTIKEFYRLATPEEKNRVGTFEEIFLDNEQKTKARALVTVERRPVMLQLQMVCFFRLPLVAPGVSHIGCHLPKPNGGGSH